MPDPTPLAAPTAAACAACGGGLGRQYYTANQAAVCAPCHARLVAESAAASLPQAGLFGIAAAVAGAALYYAILRLTGYSIGLVAVAVGYGVGRAVFTGSGKIGGRACQVMALALTYLAISACYLPATLSPPLGPGLGALAVLAVIGPIAASVHEPILLCIFGFGVWEAWRLNRARSLAWAGPFQVRGGGDPL